MKVWIILFSMFFCLIAAGTGMAGGCQSHAQEQQHNLWNSIQHQSQGLQPYSKPPKQKRPEIDPSVLASYIKLYQDLIRYDLRSIAELRKVHAQYNKWLSMETDSSTRTWLIDAISKVEQSIRYLENQIRSLKSGIEKLRYCLQTGKQPHNMPTLPAQSATPPVIPRPENAPKTSSVMYGYKKPVEKPQPAQPEHQWWDNSYAQNEQTLPTQQHTYPVPGGQEYENSPQPAVQHPSPYPSSDSAGVSSYAQAHSQQYQTGPEPGHASPQPAEPIAKQSVEAYQNSLFGTDETIHGSVVQASAEDDKQQAQVMGELAHTTGQNIADTAVGLAQAAAAEVLTDENNPVGFPPFSPELLEDLQNPDLEAIAETTEKAQEVEKIFPGSGILYAGLKGIGYVAGKLTAFWAAPVSATIEQGAEVGFAAVKTTQYYKKKTSQGLWGSLTGQADPVYAMLDKEAKKTSKSAADDFYELTLTDENGDEHTHKINATNPTMIEADGKTMFVLEDFTGNPTGYVVEVEKQPFWKVWSKDKAVIYKADIDKNEDDYAIKNTQKLSEFKGDY